MENMMKESLKDRNEELQTLLEHSHAIIQEKAELIHNLNNIISRHTE